MKSLAHVVVLVGFLLAEASTAQAPPAASRGRNASRTDPGFDPERLKRLVETIAHDSMAGRKTPSAELDKAARFIESHFRDIGALPLGDDATYLQRYPVIESVLSSDSARITLGTGPVVELRT